MKYPEMRKELLGYLEGLSNLSYQQSYWILGNCPDGVQHDELDYAVHFLFDDTTLAETPDLWIGLCLKNNDEAKAVWNVCARLNEVFQKYGHNLSDAEYIRVPEWETIIRDARFSLSIFLR